ncbi:MAG: response regulator [Gemmatimonadaceae bacterium]|nr:response regulator [Gemmatimonadaceae bacterium]
MTFTLDAHSRCALIVDDNDRYRSMLVRSMKALRFDALEASNGVQALDVLRSHPEVELLLCDIHMAEMNGLELLEQVHAGWPTTAVMMITGVDDAGIAARCMASGAMDFIAKPFRMEELRSRVGVVMERRRTLLEDAPKP